MVATLYEPRNHISHHTKTDSSDCFSTNRPARRSRHLQELDLLGKEENHLVELLVSLSELLDLR